MSECATVEYHLYPPFFVFPEEPSFEDGWEAFCCKVLKLVEARDDIVRRKPPESGVDLYCGATRTAYQCKSVECGRTGAFDPRKAAESFRAALRVKNELGWDTYVLCTNVDLTGSAEAKVREAAPGIHIRARAYWVSLCERFPDAVARNFRQLIRIPENRATAAIWGSFGRRFADELRTLSARDPATLLLYSRQHDRVYSLSISLDIRTGDLVRVLVKLFGLPRELSRAVRGARIILSHGLASGAIELTPERTLRENGLTDRSILTFWTQTQVITPNGAVSTTSLNRAARGDMGLPPEEAHDVAVVCAEAIQSAFTSFDRDTLDVGNALPVEIVRSDG